MPEEIYNKELKCNGLLVCLCETCHTEYEEKWAKQLKDKIHNDILEKENMLYADTEQTKKTNYELLTVRNSAKILYNIDEFIKQQREIIRNFTGKSNVTKKDLKKLMKLNIHYPNPKYKPIGQLLLEHFDYQEIITLWKNNFKKYKNHKKRKNTQVLENKQYRNRCNYL